MVERVSIRNMTGSKSDSRDVNWWLQSLSEHSRLHTIYILKSCNVEVEALVIDTMVIKKASA